MVESDFFPFHLFVQPAQHMELQPSHETADEQEVPKVRIRHSTTAVRL
jgi:hypothetical protein